MQCRSEALHINAAQASCLEPGDQVEVLLHVCCQYQFNDGAPDSLL